MLDGKGRAREVFRMKHAVYRRDVGPLPTRAPRKNTAFASRIANAGGRSPPFQARGSRAARFASAATQNDRLQVDGVSWTREGREQLGAGELHEVEELAVL